jgi:catechol 2,3-dioxygenase-like lactoylglutathione lyase family enzyme
MLGVAPILPSRDLEATTAFYSGLGFERAGLWPDEYLIVRRGEAGLHFFFAPSTDPSASVAGCYLYVEDADALFAEFSEVGLPPSGIPRLHGAPQDSDYGLREFAVVDLDGNLLRIGSFIAPPSGPAASASGQPG